MMCRQGRETCLKTTRTQSNAEGSDWTWRWPVLAPGQVLADLPALLMPKDVKLRHRPHGRPGQGQAEAPSGPAEPHSTQHEAPGVLVQAVDGPEDSVPYQVGSGCMEFWGYQGKKVHLKVREVMSLSPVSCVFECLR
jgi:hypothetical protein